MIEGELNWLIQDHENLMHLEEEFESPSELQKTTDRKYLVVKPCIVILNHHEVKTPTISAVTSIKNVSERRQESQEIDQFYKNLNKYPSLKI